MNRRIVALFFSLLFVPVVMADDFDFGTESEVISTSPRKNPLRGQISFEFGYQYGSPKRLMQLGPFISLVADTTVKSVKLHAEGDYRYNAAFRLEEDSQDIQDRYSHRVLTRELYAQVAFSVFSLTVGQQVVVWSKGDFLPVIDLLSARDQSRSYFARVEEIRIGQPGARLDTYLGDHTLSLWLSVFPRTDWLPDQSHPYSVAPGVTLSRKIRDEQYEGALRYNFQLSSGSIGLLAGRVHSRAPILSFQNQTVFDELYAPHNFVGVGVEQIVSSCLLKLEAVIQHDVLLQEFIAGTPRSGPRVNRVNTMIGLDYNHQTWGQFIVEGTYGYAPEFETRKVFGDGVSLVFAGTWMKRFFHDDLSLSLTDLFVRSPKNKLI